MQNKDRCVVTGLGIATSIGCTPEEFWNSLICANSGISIDNNLGHIGKIANETIPHGLSERQLKKIDRFTMLSFAATKQAISSAGLVINQDNKDQTGLLIGNSLGGWSYVEDQMYDLYRGDMRAINSYVATAWFPSAPQGEISIQLGIGGYSKTFSAEKLSSGYAIEHACYLIKKNYLEHVIAGGSEAPLTPLVTQSLIRSGEISLKENKFQQLALGEGAAMLSLESFGSAAKRNCNIYAEILETAISSNVQESIKKVLEETGEKLSGIDLIITGNPLEKRNHEALKLIDMLYSNIEKPHLVSTQALCGNTLGASMAIDILAACLIFKNQEIPPTSKNLEKHQQFGFKTLKETTAASINKILLVEIDNYGQCMSIFLKKVN
ncbi:MAG: beta-ketoacyl synthase [Gammaproteobacteria bacterium]|jgi:3-oxoacyl-(acyl-carrier-protein) synthase|nr:beta-ketoacyl synthase [Gammaproteobacteria bacterium]